MSGAHSVLQRVRSEWDHLLVAVQFLTRLPVPHLAKFEPAWLDRSVAYFPLVGLIVGGISAGVLAAANQIWPMPIAAILAVAAGIAATGAFHEDGLADTADGLGGGLTAAARLEIMKDSRIGTYGLVALVTALALKVACVAVLGAQLGVIALLAAHAGGRLVPVLASTWMPYAGEAGVAKVAPVRPTRARVLAATGFALLPFGLLPLLAGGIALGLGLLAAGLLLVKAWRLIGGQTGDVLGASEQVFEVTVLLVLAGMFA
jgi:adenosylcobinamide-GDP ribazoletransferase